MLRHPTTRALVTSSVLALSLMLTPSTALASAGCTITTTVTVYYLFGYEVWRREHTVETCTPDSSGGRTGVTHLPMNPSDF